MVTTHLLLSELRCIGRERLPVVVVVGPVLEEQVEVVEQVSMEAGS
jgi:hypothetical protein